MTIMNDDWISPPGDSIADFLEEEGITKATMAQSLNITENGLEALLKGSSALTKDIAKTLESIGCGTAAFWERREQQYQQKLEAIRATM